MSVKMRAIKKRKKFPHKEVYLLLWKMFQPFTFLTDVISWLQLDNNLSGLVVEEVTYMWNGRWYKTIHKTELSQHF